MKKQLLIAISMVIVIMASAITTNAIGPGNIRFTYHNLSNNNLEANGLTLSQRHYVSQGLYETDQVCIFCHTPHNANPAIPLWNKKMPIGGVSGMDNWFNMYTSSSTLSSAARSAKKPGPESLLCLSCHDGRTAINVVHNATEAGPTGGTNKVFSIGNAQNGDPTGLDADGGISLGNYGDPSTFGSPTAYNMNIGKTSTDPFAGTNLTDDHPISFNYVAAYNEKQLKDQSLRDINTIKLTYPLVRFFGTDNRIECSTCHDPHVYYGWDTRAGGWRPDATTTDPYRNVQYKELRPFLVMSNSGSKMCLVCHIK